MYQFMGRLLFVKILNYINHVNWESMYNDTPKSSRTKYLIYRYLFPIRVKLKKKSVDEISITMKKFKLLISKKKKRNTNVQYNFLFKVYTYKKRAVSLWFISGTQRNRSVSSPATHRYIRMYADFARETNSRARD